MAYRKPMLYPTELWAHSRLIRCLMILISHGIPTAASSYNGKSIGDIHSLVDTYGPDLCICFCNFAI